MKQKRTFFFQSMFFFFRFGFSQMRASILNGPTNVDQPTFTWRGIYNVTHQGLPETYDFSFMDVEPFEFN